MWWGDDLDNGMRLEVRSTGLGGWIVALLDGFLSSSVDEDQEGPRTVLVNTMGKTHTIKQYRSRRLAVRDLMRFSSEIEQLGYEVWSEQNGIPPHFEILQRD
jgi:hypothetical protein